MSRPRLAPHLRAGAYSRPVVGGRRRRAGEVLARVAGVLAPGLRLLAGRVSDPRVAAGLYVAAMVIGVVGEVVQVRGTRAARRRAGRRG